MSKDVLSLDFETYSEVNLAVVGTSRYSRHPSTEILMAAYSINDGPERQWIPAEGQHIPVELEQALFSPDVIKFAWNAAFEIAITRQLIGEPDIRQWRCSMVLAMTLSLPGSLDKVGRILRIEDDSLKKKDGARLMRKFSFPRKPTKSNPNTRFHWYDSLSEWEDYLAYNRNDVRAERAILRKIRRFGPPAHEWRLWHLDQKINEAGLPINMRMVDNALKVYREALKEAHEEMALITGLSNPNSQAQLLPWLRSCGYPFADLKKVNVRRAKERVDEYVEVMKTDPMRVEKSIRDDPSRAAIWPLQPKLKRVLELRLETSRTSIKKLEAIKRAVDEDGHLRNTLQFAAAGRTWRWGGRLFQPQNLPRPEKSLEKGIPLHAANVERLDLESLRLIYGNVFDLLASCIRPTAQAPEGKVFIDADLSAIENIVLGWLCDCSKILNVFKHGKDPYIDFATYMFGLPYEELYAEYKAGNSARRTISKPGVLGCGYMMSAGYEYVDQQSGEKEATGLLGYAWSMGVKHFTQEDAELSVRVFRDTYTEVVDYWREIEIAAKRCIRNRDEVRFGKVKFCWDAPFMRILLPSGRYLSYLRPKIERVAMPWGGTKMSITYEGQDERKQWKRIQTHPGKLTENVDQAIARDLLAHGMMEANRRGIDIRLHVHDQILGLCREEEAEEKLALLIECMSAPPSWASDIPLKTAGFYSKVFMKD
jgi:DNA polymerase